MVYELNCQDTFDGYNPLDVTEHRGITYRHTLTSQHVTAANLQCVAVSWNATGMMICAAFGKLCINGWCDDPGIICCWHLFREDFSSAAPSCTLNHSCCFTSLVCHPTHPSLLAAGTFNGELLVYDLASSLDVLRAVSDVNVYFHRHPVTGIRWVQNMSAPEPGKDFHLVSVSGEGKVLWWSPKAWQKVTETNAQKSYPVRRLSCY